MSRYAGTQLFTPQSSIARLVDRLRETGQWCLVCPDGKCLISDEPMSLAVHAEMNRDREARDARTPAGASEAGHAAQPNQQKDPL
jgi:hypothetical protein